MGTQLATGNQEVIDALAVVDGIVDDIKIVTDAIPDAGVMSSIAQGGDLSTLDAKVALDSTVAKDATVAKETTVDNVKTVVDVIDGIQKKLTILQH